MFGLTKEEVSFLKKLKTPIQIQDYLDTLPINWEKNGETYMSPRRVLKERKAHCLEGALVAAVALMLQNQKPLLLDLKSIDGEDHIIALYQKNRYWGAISKTNHSTLRFRDPVYKTIRELAVSYFHEYVDIKSGEKTLISYSRPFDLSKYDYSWITAEEELFDLASLLDYSRHYQFYPNENKKFLRKADAMELRAAELIEWEKENPRT